MFADGKKFMDKKRKIQKKRIKKNLISIEQPDFSNKLISSKHSKIKEGYIGLRKEEQKIKNEMIKMETEYQTTLADWEKAYQKKIDSNRLNKRRFNHKHVVFKLKDDTSDTKYYLDENGYKRKFQDEAAWKTKSITCPNKVQHTISQDDFDSLKNGKPLLGYIPCRKGGYNIKYQSQYAFITQEGKTRMYDDFLGSSNNCKNLPMIDLDNEPNGKMMWDNYTMTMGSVIKNTDSGTDCKMTLAEGDELSKHNNKLKVLINKMKENINKIIEKRRNMENKIGGERKEGFRASYTRDNLCETEKCKMVQNVEEYNKLRKKIEKVRGDIATYDGKINESKLSVSSLQMHHLIWIILGGSFVLTAIINSQ